MSRVAATPDRSQQPANWPLALLLGILIIDGFPAGAALLREFGSRPANLVLAVVGMFILLQAWLKRRQRLAMARSDYWMLVLLFIVAPLVNIPTAIYCSPAGLGEVVGTWLKQYLMLVWACLSYYVWRELLNGRSEIETARLTLLASVPALLMFYIELAAPQSPLMAVAGWLRFKEDSRPSGLATEPSVFASWTLVIWPLAYLVASNSATRFMRLWGYLMLAAVLAGTYLCNARTAAGIGVLQVLFYLVWAFRRGRIGIGSLLGILTALAATPFVIIRLMTVTDLESNLSNIGRIGSTVAGILVAADYPLLGVGIGQFKFFLASYAPQFASASDEISAWGDGSATFRASTFNLFVRLVCEFGLVIGLALSWMLSRPLAVSFLRSESKAQVCVTLSAIGGFGFWLIQDQYAYQPGIFALALLMGSIQRSEAKAG